MMGAREPLDDAYDRQARLQTKDGICAYLGHISHATYNNWHNRGLVPGPVKGTSRYDRRAHDHALDCRAGLSGSPQAPSALEVWESRNAG